MCELKIHLLQIRQIGMESRLYSITPCLCSRKYNNLSFKQKQSEENVNQDKLHKFPLLALMYSSNIGESLRPIIGNTFATLSWAPSILYAYMAISEKRKDATLSKEKEVEFNREIIYQMLGNLLIPQLVVLATRKISNKLIDKIPRQAKTSIKETTKKVDFAHKIIKKFESSSKKIDGHRNSAVSIITLITILAIAKPADIILNKFLDKILNDKPDKIKTVSQLNQQA